MTKIFARITIIVGLEAVLIGCAANSPLGAEKPSNLQSALATGRPIMSAIRQSKISLNEAQASTSNVLALICSPNPPPTAAAVMISDVINACGILRPLIT